MQAVELTAEEVLLEMLELDSTIGSKDKSKGIVLKKAKTFPHIWGKAQMAGVLQRLN